MATYLIVGQHRWTDKLAKAFSEFNYFNGDPDELPAVVERIKPKKIFFVHWSYFVPREITDNYECICFHPSHLPFGRGGTPIQNLIEHGFIYTKLTAFRMTDKLDAGPIYLQADLALEGTAQEIYYRMTAIAHDMIKTLVMMDITPVPQEGEPVYFKRRTPEQSEIPDNLPLTETYDFIRMLSAPDYPLAFINYHNYRIEFQDPIIDDDNIICVAKLKRKND